MNDSIPEYLIINIDENNDSTATGTVSLLDYSFIFQIDEDYDFPAGMNDSIPDHELMDYDEPSFSYTQVNTELRFNTSKNMFINIF